MIGTSGQASLLRAIFVGCAIAGLALPLAAQDAPTPLGDVARSLRKKKDQAQAQPAAQPATPPAPAPTVIDNDNFDKVLQDAESRHLTSNSFLYSFDDKGREFQVSAPDVTCSLSFNAHANSLLTRAYVQADLPEDEVRKLDGPAVINQDGLEISVTNGSQWRVEEITVGVTVVRRPSLSASSTGPRLLTAAEQISTVTEKQSDITNLYHLRAVAMPSTTVTYKAQLSVIPASDQEWHWAIVQARGVAPRPQDSALSTPLAPTNNAVIP
jgi:hypothetical protein